jgi:hypothetical protein
MTVEECVSETLEDVEVPGVSLVDRDSVADSSLELVHEADFPTDNVRDNVMVGVTLCESDGSCDRDGDVVRELVSSADAVRVHVTDRDFVTLADLVKLSVPVVVGDKLPVILGDVERDGVP